MNLIIKIPKTQLLASATRAGASEEALEKLNAAIDMTSELDVSSHIDFAPEYAALRDVLALSTVAALCKRVSNELQEKSN